MNEKEREIILLRELLALLVKRREKEEISSPSYDICLFLLRQLTGEINSQSRVSRRPHPEDEFRQLYIELARAGSRFQLTERRTVDDQEDYPRVGQVSSQVLL
jgi:hypothetical protein